MKRVIFTVGLMLCLFFVCSNSEAETLVVFNDCTECSSIRVVVTAPTTIEYSSYDVEKTIGDFGNSVAFDVPHLGTYMIYANCLSGVTYEWSDSVTFSILYVNKESFLDCDDITATTTTSTPSSTPCPSETIYGEHSLETARLRYFRDKVLSQTKEGQELIKLYYLWSPLVVKAMEQDEEFKEELKELINGILPLVGIDQEQADTPSQAYQIDF